MEYWYLWVAFAVLCVITVLVLRKASKAMRLHNDGQKKIYEEIERLKVLKEKYKNADAEVIEAAEPRELLGGAYAVLQSALERDENPDALFVNDLTWLWVTNIGVSEQRASIAFLYHQPSKRSQI